MNELKKKEIIEKKEQKLEEEEEIEEDDSKIKNSRKKINYNDIEPSQEEPKKEDNTRNYSNRWKFRRPEAKKTYGKIKKFI